MNRQNAAVALVQMGEVRADLAEREIINKRVPELESFGEEPLAYPVNYAVLLLRMGRPTEALHALDGTVERGRREENPYVLAHVLLTTGSTFIDLGRWDEAEAALKEAVALATNGIGNGNAAAQAESFLARLDLARGRIESARQHRHRSLDLAGYGKEKPERALSRALLVASEVALAEGATADAERFARDALQTSESVARGPDTSADVGESLLRIARARIASGASAGTKSMLERAVRCLSNGLYSNHPLTIEARTLLASASA